MIVVNSVCGCAAGKARPGIALALRNGVKPAVSATVFAGADVDATERARQYFTGYRPSSPSIALMRDGQIVYMLERSQIENRDALAIASELTAAFEKFCAAPTPAHPAIGMPAVSFDGACALIETALQGGARRDILE